MSKPSDKAPRAAPESRNLTPELENLSVTQVRGLVAGADLTVSGRLHPAWDAMMEHSTALCDYRRPLATIGLITPDLFNPYFALLASELEKAACDLGADIVLLPSRNRIEIELRHITRLESLQLDGLLLVTNNGEQLARHRRVSELGKIVLLHEPVRGSQWHSVSPDNVEGGRLAARCLGHAGHRKFLYIGGPLESVGARERGSGFIAEAALKALDKNDVTQCFGSYTEKHGYLTVLRLYNEGRLARAIFAGSDRIGEGALRAIHDLGLRVPDDVSLVCFNGAGPAHLFRPALTTVRVSTASIAYRGLTLLRRRVGASQRPVRERVDVELVQRDSVARPQEMGWLAAFP